MGDGKVTIEDRLGIDSAADGMLSESNCQVYIVRGGSPRGRPAPAAGYTMSRRLKPVKLHETNAL